MIALKLVHRHSTFEANLQVKPVTGQESQLVGGKPVGYIQAQSRSWAKDYLEQIQLVVRAGRTRDLQSGTLTTRPRCLQSVKPKENV